MSPVTGTGPTVGGAGGGFGFGGLVTTGGSVPATVAARFGCVCCDGDAGEDCAGLLAVPGADWTAGGGGELTGRGCWAPACDVATLSVAAGVGGVPGCGEGCAEAGSGVFAPLNAFKYNPSGDLPCICNINAAV